MVLALAKGSLISKIDQFFACNLLVCIDLYRNVVYLCYPAIDLCPSGCADLELQPPSGLMSKLQSTPFDYLDELIK